MGRWDKLIAKILRGSSDSNIDFNELCSLLTYLGFVERIKGGHHIFRREGVEELINLQKEGNKAKAYQVKQVRAVLVNYNLIDEGDAEI
jgi:predicted RNA binding protein YcfA (HicA-like mRNA interferase family)